MNKTLYIRADGNAQIGLGHIMRCLSIAVAARNTGQDCMFLIADDGCRGLIEQNGFSVYVLQSRWDHMEEELSTLCDFLHQNNAKQIIVDSYFVTKAYLQALCQEVNVAYIDDIAAFTYPCHWLINYNVYAKTFYNKNDYTVTKMLLGPEFTPLRPEFQGIPQRLPKQHVSRLLLTTGGSDLFGLLPCLVTQVLEDNMLGDLELVIVIGRFHQAKEYLCELAQHHTNIQIYVDTNQMAMLMQQCDIAVSAGGSTVYELCACSVPTVCFSLADNQLEIVKWFSTHGLFSYAGDVRDGVIPCSNRIRSLLREYVQNYSLRKRCAFRLHELMTGNGAQKIVESLSENSV